MKYNQSGAAIVEFALVMMIFLTFFLGILDFSRMLWTWNAANEATRWGARVAVVCQKGAPAILSSMQKFLPQLTASNVEISWYDSNGKNSACSLDTCVGVKVEITALDYQWISPIGFSRMAPIPMPSFSTYLPREIMGQDANSGTVCN